MMHHPSFIADLHTFIVRAKLATYVGSGSKLVPYRLGSRDLQYADGPWAYHDSYVGERDFSGQEVVYYQHRVAWAMSYFGRIVQPEKITSAQAGSVIQQSLSQLYRQGRFLGGWEYHLGNLHYVDTNEGHVEYFTGREWIDQDGDTVYELVYHGGLIKE